MALEFQNLCFFPCILANLVENHVLQEHRSGPSRNCFFGIASGQETARQNCWIWKGRWPGPHFVHNPLWQPMAESHLSLLLTSWLVFTSWTLEILIFFFFASAAIKYRAKFVVHFWALTYWGCILFLALNSSLTDLIFLYFRITCISETDLKFFIFENCYSPKFM